MHSLCVAAYICSDGSPYTASNTVFAYSLRPHPSSRKSPEQARSQRESRHQGILRSPSTESTFNLLAEPTARGVKYRWWSTIDDICWINMSRSIRTRSSYIGGRRPLCVLGLIVALATYTILIRSHGRCVKRKRKKKKKCTVQREGFRYSGQ